MVKIGKLTEVRLRIMRYPTASYPAPFITSSSWRSNAKQCATRHGIPLTLVLILVALAIAVSGCGSKKAGNGPAADITGVDWVLVSAHNQDRPAAPLEGGFHAYLHFETDGEFSGNDGLNAFQGTYRIDGQVLTIDTTKTIIGAQGTAVDDPRVEAVDSLIFPTDADKTSAISRFTVTPRTADHSTEMTINSASWTLVFQSEDRQPATDTHP